MRKMAALLLPLLALVLGCNWMPKVKMPRVKLSEDRPEVKVQKRIAVVLRSTDDVRFYRAMSDLTDTSRSERWDAARLLSEVVDYYPRVDSNQELEVYFRMIEALRVPRSAMVAVVAPRIGSSGSASDVNNAILRWASPGDGHGRTDFSAFAQHIQSQSAPPQNLIRWMYDRDPAAAMWQLVSIYGQRMDDAAHRKLTVGEHVISEILWRQQRGLLEPSQYESAAAEHLELLSRFNEWYVRLYVAQILSAHRHLAKADVVQRLSADENPLVSAVTKSPPKPTTRNLR